MHPLLGTEQDGISITYRALLASESKGEPTLAEVKTEDFRIREDLLRLLQVWDTLSEGTKVFLQMHCEQQAGHPSGSLVTTKQLVGKVDAGHSLALKSPVKGCASTRSVAAGVHEECKGMDINLEPLPRAPENVFLLRDDQGQHFGWRNVFQVPVSYDVELIRGLLDPHNDDLAIKHIPSDLVRRRFVVIDANVHAIYGERLAAYFALHGVKAHMMVLPGEESNKRIEAVDDILEQLTIFGLRRREPIVAIGGGVILDIVGMAANLYRRGVPYIRVPTTLLAIVDASVGVKNGVDFDSRQCGCQKNRVGSFYAPSAALLDKAFIKTQDERNIVNGLGEIMKLALVRSIELFELLESHGRELVEFKFQKPEGVADRVIELSIQIMLEELGPNLWEHKLERCVDFGHTFSKIIEMLPGVDIMHGEAVNVDGFFCVVLSRRRGLISSYDRDRIFRAMKAVGLPTEIPQCSIDMLYKGLLDAVEHRHGKQRIPLVTGIGSSICVSNVTREELEGAVAELDEVHAAFPSSAPAAAAATPRPAV